MSKRAVDFDIKPEVITGLGDLVVQFQGLEMQIRSLAQLLVPGPPRFAWMMLCELSFRRLCDFTLTLFRELRPDTAPLRLRRSETSSFTRSGSRDTGSRSRRATAE